MGRRVIIDSGPLIALFDKDDGYHQRALKFIKKFEGELITNYAVITEVTHLLDFSVRAQIDFLCWILSGGLTPVEILNDDLNRIVELTRKYSDLPMDFADASLVVLSERMNIEEIASIDKEFGIYRTQDKQRFHNVF